MSDLFHRLMWHCERLYFRCRRVKKAKVARWLSTRDQQPNLHKRKSNFLPRFTSNRRRCHVPSRDNWFSTNTVDTPTRVNHEKHKLKPRPVSPTVLVLGQWKLSKDGRRRAHPQHAHRYILLGGFVGPNQSIDCSPARPPSPPSVGGVLWVSPSILQNAPTCFPPIPNKPVHPSTTTLETNKNNQRWIECQYTCWSSLELLRQVSFWYQWTASQNF